MNKYSSESNNVPSREVGGVELSLITFERVLNEALSSADKLQEYLQTISIDRDCSLNVAPKDCLKETMSPLASRINGITEGIRTLNAKINSMTNNLDLQ